MRGGLIDIGHADFLRTHRFDESCQGPVEIDAEFTIAIFSEMSF